MLRWCLLVDEGLVGRTNEAPGINMSRADLAVEGIRFREGKCESTVMREAVRETS
jgi:hypothetical protein